MTQVQISSPNPKRVAAGRQNRKQRGPLTLQGREKLRQTALANRPWEHSTGPKTVSGKKKSAANGRKRKAVSSSQKKVRAKMADVDSLMASMMKLRKSLDS